LTIATVIAIGCGGGAEEPAPEASSAPAPKAASTPTGGGGALSGTVSFSGEAPAAEAIQMGADPSCARLHPDGAMTEIVLVGDNGGLQNVFVYVKEGLEGQSFDVPEEAALLDQQGCRYTPHVFGVRAGQTVTIMNSDDTLHNIHAMPKNNKEFNVGQPVKGLKTDRVFENPEIMVPFKCDVHKWMASYVGVVEHPFFAVTGADGSYSIPNLPAGDYVVEAWHEKYGTQQMNVTVGADGVDASFEFSG
jgi:plastocyanin